MGSSKGLSKLGGGLLEGLGKIGGATGGEGIGGDPGSLQARLNSIATGLGSAQSFMDGDAESGMKGLSKTIASRRAPMPIHVQQSMQNGQALSGPMSVSPYLANPISPNNPLGNTPPPLLRNPIPMQGPSMSPQMPQMTGQVDPRLLMRRNRMGGW